MKALSLNWDEQRGSLDGRATMLIKRLASAFGCAIDLHKFVAPDDRDCFHTHPAYAVRIILRGAYLEELESGRRKIWRAGMVGLVKPTTSHRVHKLDRGRPAYSLWLRGPKIAEIKLRGVGWPVCQEHACDKVHVTCWSCGGEGYRELYEEDPLWYNIDDVEPCDICRGEGGWLVCPICAPDACEDAF